MPKALLIVAPKNYKDKEYLYTKAALEDSEIEVRTAAKTKDTAKGVDGGEVVLRVQTSSNYSNQGASRRISLMPSLSASQARK